MLGLFTKAHLTQRSLFKSIYNILKVIFSLNKRLRDMTLFSLLVFFQMEKHAILQIGPQAGTLHLKLLLVGFGGKCSPGKVLRTRTASAREDGICQMPESGWVVVSVRHKQVARILSPSVT